MDQAKKILAQKTAILDGYANQIAPLKQQADKLGVNPGLLLGAALFVVSLLLLIFKGFAVVVTTFTVLYPGVLSIRAIESPGADDDKVWLTYWMIFGFLHVAETFLPFVFYFVPYWEWIRVAFFVWLIQFNGSTTIYEKVLRDLLRQNKAFIEEFIKKTSGDVTKATQQATQQAASAISDPSNLLKAVNMVNEVQTKAKEFATEPQTQKQEE